MTDKDKLKEYASYLEVLIQFNEMKKDEDN